MRIGFDARCLEEEKISGVGEYALELLRNLLEEDTENEYVVFSNSFKQSANRNFEWIKEYPNAKLKRFYFPNRILNFCFWYLNWPKIDKLLGGADVFFAPNLNFLSVSKKCRLIATFHDLSFERYPHFFPFKTRLWHEFFVNPRKISRTAEKLIAVSQSTKKDLETIYKTDPGKVSVVHHGISRCFKVIDRNGPKLLDIQKKYNLPYKFILYLGNVEPRKNIASVIAAYKDLVKKNADLEKYELVLAGNISPLCREMVEREKLKTCGYIKREDRPYVYNLASLFVYPSFFEGFGLPVLESMACGIPVITSNNSSIPEVAGKAAIFIDPNRPAELAQALKNILTDEKLYDKMKERGLTQSQKFSWKKCALESMPAFSGQ
jgi:glycosyltransferase involved in cell wall biosynthesis